MDTTITAPATAPVETPVTTPATPPATSPGTTVTPPTNLLVGVSEELLKHERLTGVQSVEDLASRLVNAKLAPEIPAPEGYKLPEGVPPEAAQFAHENGLTQQQLDSVIAQMSTWRTVSDEATVTELAEKGQAKLQEWGDKAKENVKLATDAVSYLEAKAPGLKQLLNETGYGNHPLLLEVFKSVGDLVKEGGFVAGETNTPAVKKSSAQRMFPSHAA